MGGDRTNRSSGCFDDVGSGNAVVNWLGGRAKAFDAPEGGRALTADWATGDVGAIGKSQDGATAIGMAASGIAGLKTIVPIEGVADNYAQVIANGAPLGTPENTSSAFTYNERAAELCKPFEADLKTRAGTNGDYNAYDRWLLGLRNGVEREPAVHLETAPGRWTDVRSRPPATSPVTFRPSADGTLGRHGSGTASVVDDPAVTREQWTARFTGAPLPAPVRIAGSPSVTITASSDKTAARLGVALVDYGRAETRNTATYGSGVENLATRSCWGGSTEADSACFLDTAADVVSVDHRIAAAGWADLGHHASLWHGEPLVPGRAYSMTFTLTALDHVVPAGHRLGLVLGGIDGLLFDPALPRLGDTVTFDLARTSVTVGLTKPEH
ncbi:CocE/NonD family hydrolase C-terminal non-catalytic domain-containing protein [Amycolatopsis mediterranei]|uniref:CocE/NonD family hydrolase C-terminal non-catalytic domain-containing protein n=1 Tax=Amycolatopsis mediterranei TaxID=33910 RepID=UPI00343BDC1B